MHVLHQTEGHAEEADHQPHVTEPRAQGINIRQQVVGAAFLAGFDQADDALFRTVLLWLLTEIVGFDYRVSAAFSIESSIVSNFILNDYKDNGEESLLHRVLKALRE